MAETIPLYVEKAIVADSGEYKGRGHAVLRLEFDNGDYEDFDIFITATRGEGAAMVYTPEISRA